MGKKPGTAVRGRRFFYIPADGRGMEASSGLGTLFPSITSHAGLDCGGVTADLFYSDETMGERPTVIYFPNYTFDRSQRGPSPQLCASIAQRGCAVFSIDLYGRSADNGACGMLDGLRDFVGWAESRADDYRLDLKRAAFAGSGTGAAMALWASLACCSGRARDAYGSEIGIRPAGIGLFSGLTDLSGIRCRKAAAALKRADSARPGMGEAFDPFTNHDLREVPPVFQAVKTTEPACRDARKLKELLDTNAVRNRLMEFPETGGLSDFFAERCPLCMESVRSVSAMLERFGWR